MFIKIPVRCEGENGEKTLYTLFDSGSIFSCIHPDYIDDIGSVQKLFRPLEVATASRGTFMRIDERVVTDFYINDIRCLTSLW